ncbi:lysine histidine transporter 2 [Actinidia rufa]|uniref:Lysine histidine transporter 2 n=1 Tax=Actinidia rufa TaxID=165716 RepID=A0A7J0EYP6_9ERIC|nr:lysine histidine transporter 2 [Actinidia rufa]
MAFNVSQVNEKPAKEKNIDDWLLITSSRNKKIVVLCFSQHHCHGWRQRPVPALCHMGAWMHTFGENLGLYIVVPQQLIVEAGTYIRYMVTGGNSLKKALCTECRPIRTTWWIMIFTSVHFFLSHLPNLNSITGISLLAAIMSLIALGDVAFAYAGHNVVLAIQATISSTPEKPSKGPRLVLFPSRASRICIIIGVLLTILSPIGALRSIILTAKNYHFYS